MVVDTQTHQIVTIAVKGVISLVTVQSQKETLEEDIPVQDLLQEEAVEKVVVVTVTSAT